MKYTTEDLRFIDGKRKNLAIAEKRKLGKPSELIKFGETVTKTFNFHGRNLPASGDTPQLELVNELVDFILEAELESNGAKAEYSNMGIPTNFSLLANERYFYMHFLNYNPPLELQDMDTSYFDPDELPSFWEGSYIFHPDLIFPFLQSVIINLKLEKKWSEDREFLELVRDNLLMYVFED